MVLIDSVPLKDCFSKIKQLKKHSKKTTQPKPNYSSHIYEELSVSYVLMGHLNVCYFNQVNQGVFCYILPTQLLWLYVPLDILHTVYIYVYTHILKYGTNRLQPQSYQNLPKGVACQSAQSFRTRQKPWGVTSPAWPGCPSCPWATAQLWTESKRW